MSHNFSSLTCLELASNPGAEGSRLAWNKRIERLAIGRKSINVATPV